MVKKPDRIHHEKLLQFFGVDKTKGSKTNHNLQRTRNLPHVTYNRVWLKLREMGFLRNDKRLTKTVSLYCEGQEKALRNSKVITN